MRSLGLIGGLAGLTAAALYLAGASGAPAAPLLVGLAPFPFFVATLGFGNLAGLIAAASALAIVIVFTAPLGLGLGLARAVAFALSAIAPALWLSHLALLRRHAVHGDPASPVEWYPLGRLLIWLAAMAGAGYLALEALAYATTGTGLSKALAAYFDQTIPQDIRPALLERTKAPDWETLAGLFSRLLPPMGGVVWQIWIAANGIGAYSLLAATHRCPRPETGWYALSLPKNYGISFAVGLVLGLIGPAAASHILLTLAALLFVPYFFLGLAVVHAIPLKGPGRLALLGLFYFLLLLLAWPAILVGIAGMLEQWSGLRARLARRPGQEDR